MWISLLHQQQMIPIFSSPAVQLLGKLARQGGTGLFKMPNEKPWLGAPEDR